MFIPPSCHPPPAGPQPRGSAQRAARGADRWLDRAGLRVDDIDLRERRYVKMQLGRVACILLAVIVPAPLPVTLVLFAGAVFLPWFGVVMANAGPTRDTTQADAMVALGLWTSLGLSSFPDMALG